MEEQHTKLKQRKRGHQRANLLMNIRVTHNEREMLNACARRRGLTMSAYILWLVRRDARRLKDDEKETE